MTLYEYLSIHTDCELEICDSTWDYATNVYWGDDFIAADKGNPKDQYYKFCIIFYKHVNIVELYEYGGTVDITGFIKKYKHVFEQYMIDHWRAECQFDLDSDFYGEWVRELCLWVDGNATDSQMRKLIELIEKEDNNG